jgi:hypothetical protein
MKELKTCGKAAREAVPVITELIIQFDAEHKENRRTDFLRARSIRGG